LLIKWFSNGQTNGFDGNNSWMSIDRPKPANSNVGLHTVQFMRKCYNQHCASKTAKKTKDAAH